MCPCVCFFVFHQEKCPSVIVVGVDPVGSILALPDSLNEDGRLSSYKVMSMYPLLIVE